MTIPDVDSTILASFGLGQGAYLVKKFVSAPQSPSKAVIGVFRSPAARQVHLEYDAPNATNFDVLRRGPNDVGFTAVAQDINVRAFDDQPPLAGDYQYKVVGKNPSGSGPESDVVTVTVTV